MTQMRLRSGIDLRALVWGIVVSGLLSVGLATAFLYMARTSDDPHVGPTAASLDDGLSTFFGAALGLLLASVLIAAVARSTPFLTAFIASLLAYAVVLVPLLVVTRPSDMAVGEVLGAAVGLGVLVVAIATVGSACGAAGGHVVRSRRA
jgi:hypothetical protein